MLEYLNHKTVGYEALELDHHKANVVPSQVLVISNYKVQLFVVDIPGPSQSRLPAI